MKYVNLNELCDINIGKTPSRSKNEYWGKGKKWLAISDLKEKYICETKEEITDLAIEKCNMKLVPKDTVIMSFKLSIGKLGIVQEEMFTNEAIANFPIKNKSLIIPEFLYYALNTVNFNNTDRAVMGATLNKAKLNTIKIPYCEISSQKKIVNILNSAQELVDKRKKQIEELDLLVKSKFIEMFGDPVLNPKGWETHILQECCTKITDGTHDTPQRLQEGRLLITGKNIRKDKIDLTDIEYVSEEDHQIIYKRCNPEYGDVLYTNIGANYGTAIFNSLDYEFSMKNVALLKPEKSKINSIYLWHYLNLRRDYILEQNKTGGAQTFMSLSTIKKLNIVVPELEIQNEYEMFIKKVDKLKFEMEKSLKELEDNFNSLMQKAFKGELFK
ncbi:restriction endonuclease subunit S [Clostridium perfringens]